MAWFGHQGAYHRENIEPTGAERDCGEDGKPLKIKPGQNKGQGYYHSFYFTSGLETTAMMLDMSTSPATRPTATRCWCRSRRVTN